MKIELNGSNYYAYTAAHDMRDDMETVVFVHGTSMDHTVWSLQSRYFAYHGYNIAAVNLPGHGLSEGELCDSVESMADWLNQIITKIPGSGVHLVGHSMGALVVLEAASRYQHDSPLLTLSLVGFSYPMRVTPVLMDAARDEPQSAYAMMTQWSHTSQLGGEPNPGFWSPGMQMSMMSNADPKAVAVDLNACNNYENGEAAFEQVHCPVLFISGKLDKMAPCKLAKQQADSKESAEISMIANAGHSIMAEKPDEVLAELKRFIGQNKTQ